MSGEDRHNEAGATLFETMNREAEKRRENIVREAQEEADRILAEAKTEAARLRDEALAEERVRETARREDDRQRAQADAQRALMTMRERVVDQVLEAVDEELNAVARGPEFPAILKQLLAETLPEAPKTAVVQAPPDHVEACRAWVEEHAPRSVSVEPDERLRDGIAVTDPDRTFRLTNTLTSRFEKSREETRKWALRRLFGESR